MTRFRIVVGAAALLAVGGIWLGQKPAPSALPTLVGAAQAQEAQIDTSTITEMVLGEVDAPVEIIEYASYTCPHCAAFHTGPYKQLKAEYIDTGKVRFIYREVYFDRYGLWASMVARCGGPDKFFGISDLIYQGQSEWTKAGGPPEIANELRKIGRLAGLENSDLEICLQDATKAQTLVAWYQENATEHGIDSTPSFIVNGEKVSNRSYGEFKALIDAELGG